MGLPASFSIGKLYQIYFFATPAAYYRILVSFSIITTSGQVVKLVYTQASGACGRKAVEVQVLSCPPFFWASGETGIHAALRRLWPQGRGGSSPLSPTPNCSLSRVRIVLKRLEAKRGG